MRRQSFLLVAALLGFNNTAVADTDDVDKVDPSALEFFTDGRGHYLALGVNRASQLLYYARGKETFYRQFIKSASGDSSPGSKDWRLVFWAPNSQPVVSRKRSGTHGHGHLMFKQGKWQLRCGTRYTSLVPVAGKQLSLLRKRVFRGVRHRRSVYLIGRDDDGAYYLVDRDDARYGAEDFRLHVGRAGAMKRLRLDEVINDGIGDIFRTKTGKLVRNRKRSAFFWQRKGSSERVEVFELQLAQNEFLVYGVLGVYRGRLGTPCDDL